MPVLPPHAPRQPWTLLKLPSRPQIIPTHHSQEEDAKLHAAHHRQEALANDEGEEAAEEGGGQEGEAMV